MRANGLVVGMAVTSLVLTGHCFAAGNDCVTRAASMARATAVAMDAQCDGKSGAEVLQAVRAAAALLPSKLSDADISDAINTFGGNIKNGDRSVCLSADKAAKSMEALVKVKVSRADAVSNQIEEQMVMQCGAN